jgi:outer membrane protein assembly factor BamB
MKKISLIYYTILASLILVWSCQNDDLPKANFDLDAVSVFTGTVGHEKIDLNWEAPANKTPQEYVLKVTPGYLEVTLDNSITNYEVKELNNGVNYSFNLQAIYGPKEISGTTQVKLTPIDELNFTALPGNQFAVAQWDIPNRTDISGYTLTWEPNGQTVEIPSGTNTYQITGLTNDVEYSFVFEINYSGGNSSGEVQAAATPGEISAFLLNVESPMATELAQFTYNPAYLPGSTAASWNYDFGDGSSSTEQNPTHIYSVPGVYDVIVQITDEQGTIFSDTQQVFVWGEKWAYDIGAQIKQQIPAIATDGTIYVGSEDNSNIFALNPDGTLKWTYSGLGDNQGSSAPSIGSDGTIYVGSKDSNLHALNPDGTLKWKFLMAGDPIWSSPAIANDGTIYIGSDGDNLYAINPDGTQKWVFNTAGFNIRSTPTIASDGTVYIASQDLNLYALDADNGAIIWSFPLGGKVDGSLSINSDGSILVGLDKGSPNGALLAINPDGTEKWSKSTGRIFSSPTIANGTIYVGTKEGNNLLAIDASNGSDIWSFSAENIILSSPTIDKNGAIYFGSFDDNIYVLNPDGSEKYKVNTGANVWSSAVIGDDGTIYIGGYDGKLHAFEFFAESLAVDVWPIFGKNVKHTGR